MLRVGEGDNVVVAARDLAAGEEVGDGDARVTLAADVPFGHKVAVRTIESGGDVVKYDEVIGRATAAIEPGAHVHVHNVDSARLPG